MQNSENNKSLLDKALRFFLVNKLVVILLTIFLIVWGVMVAPFDWNISFIPRDPVPVDAIPDIGENQQIVFTEWMGRSPQDIDDQITYPLTVALLGIPGVKTIRSNSFFGFSSIYIIFKEDIEFYWSRSRVLEKLASLPAGTLPDGVRPALGPDATSLGQVFWYTLEGKDKKGNFTGGWDLDELRTQQDWYVRYALQSVDGVSEVASIGGFVREYQIDVDPDAMRAHHITLDHIFHAVKNSNVDVGARTIEVNSVEYFIRGLGFIKSPEDIEKTVITDRDNVPIFIKDVAHVSLGPALRRGALDKGGAEVVGGVVVVRYGENPLAVIKKVKKKIQEITPGLPTKVLPDGSVSQVSIVPFYDRSGLIYETLGTLNTALLEEILVTIIVILIMLMHFRSSLLISGLLPLAVLMSFIAMKLFRVDANIVALSGIAIAIGTMVDMGIVLCENILKHLGKASEGGSRLETIFKASSEVGGAVLTAVATTVISFLPVFTMEAAEGKLFKPLAFTKTFALISSLIVALFILPAMAHIFFKPKREKPVFKRSVSSISRWVLIIVGVSSSIFGLYWIGSILLLFGIFMIFKHKIPEKYRDKIQNPHMILIVALVAMVLAKYWMPLGLEKGVLLNFVFVGIITSITLGSFYVFQKNYQTILSWALIKKKTFLLFTVFIVLFGTLIWIGFDSIFGFIPKTFSLIGIKEESFKNAFFYRIPNKTFPGLGKEFMPPLDEGSYLYMPTTMPHASIGEAIDVLQKLDMSIQSIPEVDSVVGKIGRVESPLDPAPISMVETVINYKPEYITDRDGKKIRFKYDRKRKKFTRDKNNRLIMDRKQGRPFRQWRDHIKKPDDIWKEIVKAGEIPGTTSAPRLQPIAARIVMLQSGMRAPMGLKIKGPDLNTIDKFGLEIEKLLKEVPMVESSSVIADRIVGKPYLEIDIDREAIARYGISVRKIQDVIEIAIGGRRITTTVEGRERYPVRVRYKRELRDHIDSLGEILVPSSDGAQIPLIQLSQIKYVRGPQVIKSEDTFLVGYVLFDKKAQFAEVDVVESAQDYLNAKISSGELVVPTGVSFAFAGSYENQIRSEKKLRVVLPLALFVIFLILYFQFRSTMTTLIVFSGIVIAWAGGFILVWLYSQGWFLNFSFFGTEMRTLFQIHPINLSVAVWVGFLALFGIASDNGVILATYLDQTFEKRKPDTIEKIRQATIEGATRRIRPCLMTTATTILALIPILTSSGRGSDVMLPMAIPSFGGMLVAVVTTIAVPVLYSYVKERKI